MMKAHGGDGLTRDADVNVNEDGNGSSWRRTCW
jgi:hypothetical protein